MDEKEKYPVNEEFKKKADAKQEKSDYERMSSPDQVDTDTESLFDKDESMKHVDPIPVEELNDQVEDEKPGNREDTKSTSSSERKYPHQDK